MSAKFKDLALLTIITVTFTFLLWLPHILAIPNFWGLSFKEGFNTIYRNFDGLEYIVIAKTFYNPEAIANLHLTQPADYFASHFPGYPLLISLFAPFLGYLKSMLFVSLLFTVLSAWAFYFLVKDFKLSAHPLTLSLIFLILPARWVIVHSIGSPEPAFIFFIILSIYFFLKNKIWAVAVFAAAAQLIRPPGILLGIALGLYILWQGYRKKSVKYILSFYPLIFIPLTLLGIFYWYSITYQDFFAYFHSGDNIHLTFPPFQVFNKHQFWVGDIWLEDVVYIFMLGFLGGMFLIKQKLYSLAFFVLTYLTASIFVAHRDISRYLLPIAPFVIIAFEKILVSKEFKIVLAILALTIYLYSQNYIINNVAPVPDLSVYN
ncbi:hypothetical protein A3B42_01790 [Candidatus Daviesbacteria bacterium RIFCSPLOWO2_01_FULL_38_10]|nr:MAG: hypothetical protein US80_C0001G0062 [Candidatus Daviesbacteria bacterium GW2011_GWA2_38_17]OGE27120.1 MAG: hypothetical protein A3D02_04485 [Candidatus Daviesbacteria bacterium RIFCSPHIGHO2_02_FULL_39_41]OGE38434.1 MAG: hypothetical protein A3B42_01790 [Candidatus Daviesbacteria bacterium RIFCSPLOWO2_01_FULL_38_10]OGE45011.1 MAG: hypothetical protein A3E67_02515 [Candidatus Daviesbacteria bacterium RIFCSPHIGHO2_12_FULL_38_25]OGE68483.1 MAG: hypothetical protein A3H81_06025 [Candidatus 